ncbi:MAG: DNA glycosylase [Pseudonocardiales bacterium]|nr:DNA glycosylase [Pseudonocardiales bacterium]
MAEGDSIARLAARLDARTAGALIVRSDLRHPRVATADLAGMRITGWRPRGKHLLMRTDAGWTLHSHLRMSGSWSVLRPGSRYPRDLRVGLGLDDGRTVAGVALPVVTLVRTRDEARVVGHLGPDLLADDPDLDAAAARLRAVPERAAVVALLDQRAVAGLGNMWAQEVLFLERTSPWRPIGGVDLPPLLARARRLLREAVATNHRQVTTGDPRPGRRHFVYGRKGRPCLRCGTPVAFAPAGHRARETWWCPRCQAE